MGRVVAEWLQPVFAVAISQGNEHTLSRQQLCIEPTATQTGNIAHCLKAPIATISKVTANAFEMREFMPISK